jgi:hypothetical protein
MLHGESVLRNCDGAAKFSRTLLRFRLAGGVSKSHGDWMPSIPFHGMKVQSDSQRKLNQIA